MSRVCYEISVKLDVLAPLHVGTGVGRRIASIGAPGSNEGPDVAAIVRDVSGNPAIPSTSIKGLLRRLGETAEGLDDGRIADLFGDLGARGGVAKAGCVLVRGAYLEKPGNAAKMPFADARPVAEGGLGAGIFVAARTAIDPAKGIAEDHKLQHAEMVALGARFAFGLVVEARGPDAGDRADAAARDIMAVLALLDGGAASAIGSGTGDGAGRIRIAADGVTASRRHLTASGNVGSSDASRLWRNPGRRLVLPRAARTERVVLVADGPYLVADASAKPRGRQQGEDRKAQIAAERISDDRPLASGSGIAGALRARARWLVALAAHGGSPGPVGSEAPPALDRLFGTSAFKGLMSIEATCSNRPKLWTAASVRIDRFTGGPIQNALFHTEAFVGVRLEIVLRLAARPLAGAITPAEIDLFDTLVADLRENGLMLGHGVNRGYGWFRAEKG